MSENLYVLVQWPESQEFMEEEWFEKEAILEVEGRFGSGAYFIPAKRLRGEYKEAELKLVNYRPLEIERGMLFAYKFFDSDVTLLKISEVPNMSVDEYAELYGYPVKLQLWNESTLLNPNDEEIGWIDEGDNIRKIEMIDINNIISLELSVKVKLDYHGNLLLKDEKIIIKIDD